MIGRHEAALVLACRQAEHEGTVITQDQAQDIAALWQSPSRRSQGITAFASSGRRLASLRSEVEREIASMGKWQSPSDAVSRLELRALLAWITANPIEIIRYEHVVFMQGDDADEILDMIYPNQGQGSTGWPDGAQDALEHVKGWDYGEPTDVPDSYEDPASSYGSHSVSDDHYVLAWNHGLGWVSLHRIEREVG